MVGDIDLAVLSTSFDEDGARGPIDPGVVDTVRSIPGVAGAQGAMQRFVDVLRTDSTPDTAPPASERSAIAISWEEGAPLAFSAGGTPQGDGEIAINQSLAEQYQVGVGDELVLNTGATMGGGAVRRVLPSGEVVTQQARPSGSTARVVGVFTPAGGDVDDINLVVMRAEDLATATNRPSFDRVDIVTTPDVPIDEMLDRVSAALPGGTMVVPPSVVGFDEQLRGELEIQRAYHWVLSPDRARGRAATFGAPDDPESIARNQATYDANLWQTVNTELRVSRVAFVDNATALVTYRAYYGGVPSEVVRTPMTGVAERIDGEWRLSQAGLCELGKAANVQCAGTGGPTASAYAAPPNGWNAADSVPGAVQAFRVLADPTTTVEQRVLAVDQGPLLPRRHRSRSARRRAARHRGVIQRVGRPAPRRDARPGSLLGDRRRRPASGDAVPVRRQRGARRRNVEGGEPLRVRADGIGDAVVPGRGRAADDHHELDHDVDHDDRPAVDRAADDRAADDRPRLGRRPDHPRHSRPDDDRALSQAGTPRTRWRRRKRNEATSPAGSGSQ